MIHKIEFKGNVFCCIGEKYFAAVLYIGESVFGIEGPNEPVEISKSPSYVEQVEYNLRGKVYLPSRSKK